MSQQATLLAAFLAAFSSPHRRIFTVPRTMGHNEIASVGGMWGLLFLALFAGAGRSDVLWCVLVVAVLVQAEHRLKTRRDPAVHSRSIGRSQLERHFSPAKARLAEVLIALAAAAFLTDYGDGAAGLWFALTAFGHLCTVSFAQAKNDRIEDEINDARLDVEARSYRQPTHRLVKPWDVRKENRP